jgi:hypothetical protein
MVRQVSCVAVAIGPDGIRVTADGVRNHLVQEFATYLELATAYGKTLLQAEAAEEGLREAEARLEQLRQAFVPFADSVEDRELSSFSSGQIAALERLLETSHKTFDQLAADARNRS